MSTPDRIVLFGSRRPLDAFAGVPERIDALGDEVWYEGLWGREARFGHHAQPRVIESASLLAFADLSFNMPLRPTMLAHRLGVPTALLVDGVMEFANTCMNPWLGPAHLRQMPHDVVLAMGPLQGTILEALGNRVLITGLPRLDGYADRMSVARKRVEPDRYVLVSTALAPAMDDGALSRVGSMLRSLREILRERGLEVRWRIDTTLARGLGVPADDAPLALSLAGARATITTASTLAVESMLAGVPTAVAHPHPWPLWAPAGWVWQAEGAYEVPVDVRPACEAAGAFLAGLPIEHAGSLGALVEMVTSTRDVQSQQRVLDALHVDDAATRVARALHDTTHRGHARTGRRLRGMGSTIVRQTPRNGPRVLNVAVCDHVNPRPEMVERALALMDDPRTHLLCVGLGPMNYARPNIPTIDHPRAHACVLEPTAGEHERARALLRAALALRPDAVVIDDERALALAAQLVTRGVRCDDPRLGQRNDFAVRHVESWPWSPRTPASWARADAWIACQLRRAGYQCLAMDAPSPGCDAVLVGAASPRPDPLLVARWRAAGLGVGVSPNMSVERGVVAAQRAIERLRERGCGRLAVAGFAERSAVLAGPITRGAPIVGWLDDAAGARYTHLGLPAHGFDRGIDRLKPDGVLLLCDSALEQCAGVGLPVDVVRLEEVAADEFDSLACERVHGETLADAHVDGS